MNDKVTEYIVSQKRWEIELSQLRDLLLSTELVETLKWGMPTYTIDNKNVVGISGFKNHYALWFHQGVFLLDNHKLLYNAQEGKTKGMRQIRFTENDNPDLGLIREYVLEAIQNQKDGKVINNSKPAKNYSISPLLHSKLSVSKTLKEAFSKLTIAKQKSYSDYILDAKRTATKTKRMEEIIPMIRAGKSLSEKYSKK